MKYYLKAGELLLFIERFNESLYLESLTLEQL